MADSTLGAIRTKVRRLTRSPSESQLTTAQLDEYINTSVLYDFPQHLRIFSLRTTLTFYTQPNVDVYETNTTVPTDPLFDFKNRYISIHDPVYIGGYQVLYSQSRNQFFGIYPFVNFINKIGSGNGGNTFFTGTLSSKPVLQNNVLFTSIDTFNNGLILKDVPVNSQIGNLFVPDNLTGVPFGSINYITGGFSFDFPAPPGAGKVVNSETVPYVAARPQAILFYDDKFTIRPVPDIPYPVNLEVYVMPTELLDAGQSPQIQEWWQYISYLASLKIFQDRMDLESAQMIMPELKKQEVLVQRKTILQNSNDRTATIYTESAMFGQGGYGFGFGNGPF